MKLLHLPLEQLKISPLNARKKGGKDIADLVPSIRSLGIIQPLLVRPNCEGFEIVAGQRRYRALVKLAEEGEVAPVPVAMMENGDDAKALEASLAENYGHRPMCEIDEYKAFAALKAEGLDVPDIAARFAVSEKLVNQRLAIAGIIDSILNAYRREEIRPDTLRILTMATTRQQKAWWQLFKSEDEYAPTGRALKDWLFGGGQIPVSNALFDLERYSGAIISDLFGNERYFADADAFWQMQNAAIAEKRNAYLAAGWSEVVVLDIGQHFSQWSHTKTPKKKDGKVFIAITHDGEVTFHEGWLTEKEARQQAKASAKEEADAPKQARPELTKAMRNYLGLHRHAAVRTELLAHSGIALRLALAHMVAGSGLWRVEADNQKADSEAIADTLAAAQAQAGFAEERGRMRRLLGIKDKADEPITHNAQGHFVKGRSLYDTFQCLLQLEDEAVLRTLAFVMAETLEAHTDMIDTLGALLGTDMRNWWKPDETFFDLLRDKAAVNDMVREIAGDMTADAHVAATAKVQKKIVTDCLSGENGRAKVDGWLPRYMAFPATGYTSRFIGHACIAESDGTDDAAAIDDADLDVEDEINEAA